MEVVHPGKGAREHHDASEHSIWPFVLAVGVLIVAIGLLASIALCTLGGVVVLVAVWQWLSQSWIS